jgi:hypothetical protein
MESAQMANADDIEALDFERTALRAERDELVAAAKALIADDDIYLATGRRVPRDASYWANLRAAVAKAEGRS